MTEQRTLRAVPAALAAALNPPERIALGLLHAYADAALRALAQAPALEFGLAAAILWLAGGLLAPMHRALAWASAAAGVAALAFAAGPALRAASALLALHGEQGPALPRLCAATMPLDMIPLPPGSIREWVASGCEAAGILVADSGEIDLGHLAARLREAHAGQPCITALDAGLARLVGRLAAALETRRPTQKQVALACALACPDPPAVLWREVLAAALQEADKTEVRRDLYIVARLHRGGAADVGTALRLMDLPARDAALVLSAHERALRRELGRGAAR
jgi:hypothetical protein